MKSEPSYIGSVLLGEKPQSDHFPLYYVRRIQQGPSYETWEKNSQIDHTGALSLDFQLPGLRNKFLLLINHAISDICCILL